MVAEKNPPVNVTPAGAFIPDPPDEDDDRFSRTFKSWREWNVAVNFLTNLHFGVDEAEVFSLQQDPPDVFCRGACFEVKEIMDPGRRRHDEVKATKLRRQLGQASTPKARYSVEDLTPTDVGALVLAELHRLDEKRYLLQQRTAIDLLFYVNKLEHWFENGAMPSPRLFASHGWRSVSAVVATQQSLVFHTLPGAPAFLVENTGIVRQRWEPLGDD
ncbi:DUF1780 domain-containing protein [Variovorax sp.]|jgi:hypothetical protein|uniref:DUF1780 domain-containing protein n=1 Tax=Variovorax sp. TaxID=1871043 RepID=UPI0037DA073C